MAKLATMKSEVTEKNVFQIQAFSRKLSEKLNLKNGDTGLKNDLESNLGSKAY